MPRCAHCQSEIPALTADGLCPGCGMPLGTVSDIGDATIELPPQEDSGATVDFSQEGTVDFGELPSDESATVDLPTESSTQDFAADRTLDFGAADAASVSLAWGDAASQTVRQDQTLQIGDTVSGFRSSLPIKSRSLRPTDTPGVVDLPKPRAGDAESPDYELLSLLGQGGMGVVYAAKQSSIARTVAVKMLKTGDKPGSGSQGTSDQRDKFISEAVITGELEHPNIVPIYDLGANDEGALFYSMKRVRGTPWDEVIADRSLTENLGILMRVADAVAFAHANGVIHRDLKPENVMLGDFGEVLVMDWGLARITPDFPSAASVHQSDNLGGTPAYMAPEMARGPIEAIDATSDVYLLGAMLYEVIGGKPPHTGKNVMDCLMAASGNKIQPIDYEGELRGIALRAMETHSKDRYASVKNFQQGVQEYLAHSESITLSAGAERSLEAAHQENDYELYSRALYGFEEALSLWSENERAQTLLGQTRVDYAAAALAKGDFDLGASLLESPLSGADPSQQERATQLREELAQARTEREARQRRLRDLKRLAAVLLLSVAGLGTYSYFEIRRQKTEAVAQRNNAEEQRSIAVEKKQEADEQRGLAEQKTTEAVQARAKEEQQRRKAEEQEQIAKEQEQIAKTNEHLAIQNEKIADTARQAAELAKQNEAYAAYVARIGLAAAKIDENAFREASALLDACPTNLRHWEWGRLRYLCELSDRVDDLGAPVDAVVYAPDGKSFVTGDWNGHATRRDVGTGEVRWSMPLCQYVHAVAFSPDGRQIVAGGSDGMVRLLDAATGKTLAEFQGHDDAVLTVAFSPDGRRIVSGGYDETARIWDTQTGQALQTLEGHTWWVWSARFSPDRRSLVTTGQDGRAIVWQWQGESYEQATEFTRHEGPVYDAVFSPDGKRIATAGYDQTVRVWHPEQVSAVDLERRLDKEPDLPSPHQLLQGHSGPVRSVAFTPDGQRLLSGSQDNTLRVWDLEDSKSQTLRGHGGRVFAVACSPDGQSALSAGHDHQVRQWTLGTYHEQLPLHTEALVGHQDAVLSARFSADGQKAITASRDRSAQLWDLATGESLVSFTEGHEFLASSALLVDAGRTLVTSAGDNTVRVWDVATTTERQVLSDTGRSAALAVDPAGKWTVTGGPDGAIRWWDLRTGKLLDEQKAHEKSVTALATSADGQRVASGDQRGTIHLWHKGPRGWEPTTQLKGHSRKITAIRFTPDGQRIVSASGDRTCGQWDVATGKELRQLVLKHPDWVSAMDLSADGRLAITACDDGRVRLWQIEQARVLAETEFPGTVPTAVDFSPEATEVLITCSGTRTVSRWNLANRPQVLLDKSHGAGLIWSARYGTDHKTIVTVGGNDARFWRLDPLRSTVEFSPHGAVADAALSPNGQRVATGSWDHSAKLWDAVTGKALKKLDGGHTGFINTVAFSPDGNELLTASDDRTVRFWQTKGGKLESTQLKGHTGRVLHATYGAQGDHVLTASTDRTARLWERATGQTLQTFVGHEWGVLTCDLSHDGKMAVTGSADNMARVWDTTTGKLRCILSGHTASVSSVAISPDGRRVLTGGQDNAAKLWDAVTGKEILTLAGHTEEVTSVAFSPDGQAAITAGRDGRAILWPAADWTTQE